MAAMQPQGTWVIIISFLLALMLSAVPLPDSLQWGWPEWVALFLIYWTIALPHRVGVGVGFMLGLLLDVIEGTLLGQNALALSILAYLSLSLYQRMRMYPAWQQSLLVFLLVGLHQMVFQWVQSAVGVPASGAWFLLPPLVSALLWPWLFVVLRAVRRRFRVT